MNYIFITGSYALKSIVVYKVLQLQNLNFEKIFLIEVYNALSHIMFNQGIS